LARPSFLLSSKVQENMKAEYNDVLVLLDAPVVIMEGALGIHLECHQFHRPLSISVTVLISLSCMALFLLGVRCLQLQAELFLAVITQVMWCELFFQAISNCVGFL
jgi:hypothetical protein